MTALYLMFHSHLDNHKSLMHYVSLFFPAGHMLMVIVKSLRNVCNLETVLVCTALKELQDKYEVILKG